MSEEKIRCNPDVVVRDEDEHGTLLFNPDTGDVLVLNQTGRFIWDLCIEGATPGEIVRGLEDAYDEVPATVTEDVDTFLGQLLAGGFAGTGHHGDLR